VADLGEIVAVLAASRRSGSVGVVARERRVEESMMLSLLPSRKSGDDHDQIQIQAPSEEQAGNNKLLSYCAVPSTDARSDKVISIELRD
jgi:hypothetical protein